MSVAMKSGSDSTVLIGSADEQDALAEQVGFGEAVHLSFDHLVSSVESERHLPAAQTRPAPARIPTKHGFCGLPQEHSTE
jgi:hypothetical protein